jgi:serine/threonine-protein kinase
VPEARSIVSTPLLDDQPSSVDLLNFGQYAAALREVVLNPQTKTPFVIGIFGRWGTGKTTLMRMLERELAPRDVTTVWFSAWPYAQEQEMWAAFLQALTIRLTERLGLRDKLRLSAGMFRRSLAWDRLLHEAPRLLLRAALVAVPAAVGALLVTTATDTLSRLVGSAGVAGSVGLTLWYAAKAGASAARGSVRPDFTLYRSSDFERHVGFLERFRSEFAQIVDALPGARGRLVVFVDDLDRCSPDKALQLLDAIKVFLDVPGCIFLLGVDVAVLQKALSAKYPEDGNAQREYLAKIVQLAFHLPPLTQDEMGSYIRHLNVTFPDERCRGIFLAALAQNPREVKRVINSYSLHLHLADAASANLDPVRLAKVVVIQQTFAPLFTVLRERPEWLSMLERAILAQAGLTLDDEPEAASEDTLVGDATLAGVPPALTPFVSEPALQRLLTMYADVPSQADAAGFARLPASEIAPYFTLARRLPSASATPSGAVEALEPAPAESPLGPSYRVLRVLGTGAASDVVLAEHRLTGRLVAIKSLPATLRDDPEWVARFRREMNAIARVAFHPNIVQIHDVHPGSMEPRSAPYYVMEYVPGMSLKEMLDTGERIEIDAARRLLAPVFDALSHVHAAGIVHRNIKPSAIRVTPDGTPKLGDFTLAIEGGTDTLTQAGTVIGTPAYMSPEQFRGERVDRRTDLFSFGVVIFQVLTGERPFEGGFSAMMHKVLHSEPPAVSSLVPAASPALDRFIARMLAKDPDARFADASEAKAAFLEALDTLAAAG